MNMTNMKDASTVKTAPGGSAAKGKNPRQSKPAASAGRTTPKKPTSPPLGPVFNCLMGSARNSEQVETRVYARRAAYHTPEIPRPLPGEELKDLVFHLLRLDETVRADANAARLISCLLRGWVNGKPALLSS